MIRAVARKLILRTLVNREGWIPPAFLLNEHHVATMLKSIFCVAFVAVAARVRSKVRSRTAVVGRLHLSSAVVHALTIARTVSFAEYGSARSIG